MGEVIYAKFGNQLSSVEPINGTHPVTIDEDAQAFREELDNASPADRTTRAIGVIRAFQLANNYREYFGKDATAMPIITARHTVVKSLFEESMYESMMKRVRQDLGNRALATIGVDYPKE